MAFPDIHKLFQVETWKNWIIVHFYANANEIMFCSNNVENRTIQMKDYKIVNVKIIVMC